MNEWKQFLKEKVFSGKDKEIQFVLFNVITCTACVACVISLLLSLAMMLPWLQIVGIAFTEVTLIMCIVYANVVGDHKKPALLICVFIVDILFPVMFFTGGGVQGGMPLWFCLGIIFCFLLLEGKAFYITAITGILIHGGCFVVSYLDPTAITEFDRKIDSYFDIYQSLVFVALCIGMIVRFQVRSYEKILSVTIQQNHELELARNEAEEAKKRAIEASRAKSDFLANMSHEIRTPINAVLGMDEMILRECSDPEILDYASDIRSAGKALLSLVNDILDFSKIESGHVELSASRYSAKGLIRDCYNLVSMRAAQKGLKFFVNADSSIPTELEGDEVHIRQIIVNLLTNGVKYTIKGSVTMNVSWRDVGENLGELIVSVSDTGIGITTENQKKLFDSFQRVDERRNRNIEGTGLGLAITKQLVDLMGGSIEVESIYDVGSKFTVIIPQIRVGSEITGKFVVDREESIHSGNAEDVFTCEDKLVLVVDDNRMNLRVVQGLLRPSKVQIETASSGKECLGMIVQKKYDLIFMDHLMPQMDGIETFRAMKKLAEMGESKNDDTPVIMFTANAIDGVKEQYMDAGFADYLTKPVLGKDLNAALKKHFKK